MIPLQDLKDWLGITDASEDEWLQRQIDALSAVIEQYTARWFARRAYSFEWYCPTIVQVPQFPVVTPLTSLTADGVAVDAAGYHVVTGTGRVFQVDGNVLRNWDGVERLKMSCTAGHEPTPADVALLFEKVIGARYEARVSKSIAGDPSRLKRFTIQDVGAFEYQAMPEASAPAGTSGALDFVAGFPLYTLDHYRDFSKLGLPSSALIVEETV